jgi:hypothetical protein
MGSNGHGEVGEASEVDAGGDPAELSYWQHKVNGVWPALKLVSHTHWTRRKSGRWADADGSLLSAPSLSMIAIVASIRGRADRPSGAKTGLFRLSTSTARQLSGDAVEGRSRGQSMSELGRRQRRGLRRDDEVAGGICCHAINETPHTFSRPDSRSCGVGPFFRP